MTFHEFIFTSSIVMAPDLKNRPRTDGGGGGVMIVHATWLTDHASLNRFRFNFQ